MLATLAALAVSTCPSLEAKGAVAAQVLVAAKKKKRKPESHDSKVKEVPEETSEGLDLTGSDASSATSVPTDAPSSTEAAPPPSAEVAAAPAAAPPAAWSVATAQTAGEGANVVFAEVGWPGVAVGYTRGLLAALDVGARVGFNWSYEGLVTRPLPGLRFQVQGRYRLFERGSLSLSVHLAPGGLVYFFAGGARGGLVVPVGATLGLPELVQKLRLAVSLEVPFWVIFGVGGVVPIVAGAHAEYPLTDALVVFAKLRPLGIAIWTNGAGVFYTFEGLVGVAFHL